MNEARLAEGSNVMRLPMSRLAPGHRLHEVVTALLATGAAMLVTVCVVGVVFLLFVWALAVGARP